MRIVHVSEVVSGGVRGLLGGYAADQLARGHDVHVIGGPELAGLPGTHHEWRGDRHHPTRMLAEVRRLRRLITDLAPQVVHLHSFFAGAFGRLALYRTPFAVVYQPHGWAFDAVRHRSTRGGIEYFERWAGRHTDLLATNCTDEIDEGRRHGIGTLAVPLGVPVDLEWFVPICASDKKALRSRLGLDDRPTLLCLGRIARQKGYDILVEEWERHPIPETVLVLVGSGTTQNLARLAPEQWGKTVHAVGVTDDPRAWLQAADLMLLPSRYEGQSVAVTEALACGLPVVAFDVNGARAAICDGGDPAGAVVRRGDVGALLAEARRRVSEPFLRETESLVARSRAERDSVPAQIHDRLMNGYHMAIADRRARRS